MVKKRKMITDWYADVDPAPSAAEVRYAEAAADAELSRNAAEGAHLVD